jgi:V8-like Glu-specific endopeptidase
MSETAIDNTADVDRLARTARALLQSGGLVESVGGTEQIRREDISRVIAEQLLAPAATAATTAASPEALAQLAAEKTVAAAEAALSKLAGGTAPGHLSDDDVSALEAIVLVSGRPAMRFVKDRVQMPPDLGDNGPWRVIVAIAASSINLAAESVGRIDLTSAGNAAVVVGTGWRIGADLVITNRHVVRDLVSNPSAPVGAWSLDPAKPSTIQFGEKSGAPFAVGAVAYVAPEEAIDFAALRIQPAGRALPDPLAIQWDQLAVGRMIPQGTEMVFQGKKIYVIGHPWRAFSSSAVAAVFGQADGSKRWSPGYARVLSLATPSVEHDCSTLGGHSGSCVLSADGHDVVALHFGGLNVKELSGTGTANTALPVCALTAHPAGDLLRTGHI